MGRRWTLQEEEALKEVRIILKDELAARIQFPEVVGDRRLLRFLRGKAFKIDESVKCIREFFKWRDTNGVDKIRQDIIYGGKDTPFKFPFGKDIIDIAPQIIITSNSLDKKGRPLAMETFNFSPKEIFEAVPISDYLIFLTYTLEYRAIVLEQMSHERELEYISKYPNPEDRTDGYGVIVMDYTIRDLKGVGLAHLGSKGRALVAAALNTALPNYPEFLDRCVMINTPWVFNTFWYFVKGFLDEITAVKVAMCGTDYLPVLLEDMDVECIPERLGGQFTQYNEAYVFDTSIGGPLHCKEAAAAVVGEGGESDRINELSDTCWHSVRTPTTSLKSELSQKHINSSSSSSSSSRFQPYSKTTSSGVDITATTHIPVLQKSVYQNTSPATAIIRNTNTNVTYDKNVVSIDISLIYLWCWKHPVRLLQTILCLCLFAYLRITGNILQYMVFPGIIYATLLNTRPVVRYIIRFYSINPDHSEG